MYTKKASRLDNTRPWSEWLKIRMKKMYEKLCLRIGMFYRYMEDVLADQNAEDSTNVNNDEQKNVMKTSKSWMLSRTIRIILSTNVCGM